MSKRPAHEERSLEELLSTRTSRRKVIVGSLLVLGIGAAGVIESAVSQSKNQDPRADMNQLIEQTLPGLGSKLNDISRHREVLYPRNWHGRDTLQQLDSLQLVTSAPGGMASPYDKGVYSAVVRSDGTDEHGMPNPNRIMRLDLAAGYLIPGTIDGSAVEILRQTWHVALRRDPVAGDWEMDLFQPDLNNPTQESGSYLTTGQTRTVTIDWCIMF